MTTEIILIIVFGFAGWLFGFGISAYIIFYKRKVHIQAEKTRKINCKKLDTIMNNQLIANDSTLTNEQKVSKINENIASCLSVVRSYEEETSKKIDEIDKTKDDVASKIIDLLKEMKKK